MPLVPNAIFTSACQFFFQVFVKKHLARLFLVLIFFFFSCSLRQEKIQQNLFLFDLWSGKFDLLHKAKIIQFALIKISATHFYIIIWFSTELLYQLTTKIKLRKKPLANCVFDNFEFLEFRHCSALFAKLPHFDLFFFLISTIIHSPISSRYVIEI